MHYCHINIITLSNKYKTFNNSIDEKRIFDTIKNCEKYFFFQGSLNNPRIRIQQGAFLVFIDSKLHEKFNEHKETDDLCELQKVELSKEIESIGSKYKTATIKSKYKQNILKELDQLGINHSTLFPDLENYSKHIRSKYK